MHPGPCPQGVHIPPKLLFPVKPRPALVPRFLTLCFPPALRWNRSECVSQLLVLKWGPREHKEHFTSTVSKPPSSFWQYPLDKIPGVGWLHQRVWAFSWLLKLIINLLSKGAALSLHSTTSDAWAPCLSLCQSWVWQFYFLICANLIGVKLNLILICISLIIMKVECFL